MLRDDAWQWWRLRRLPLKELQAEAPQARTYNVSKSQVIIVISRLFLKQVMIARLALWSCKLLLTLLIYWTLCDSQTSAPNLSNFRQFLDFRSHAHSSWVKKAPCILLLSLAKVQITKSGHAKWLSYYKKLNFGCISPGIARSHKSLHQTKTMMKTVEKRSINVTLTDSSSTKRNTSSRWNRKDVYWQCTIRVPHYEK